MSAAATLADIYLAAHKAAEQLKDVSSQLDLETKKLAEFNLTGFDPLDYPAYDAHFNERRNALIVLAKTPAPSVKAAMMAEASKKSATQAA